MKKSPGANILSPKKFSTTLLKWNALHNDRKMPWKGESDPYKIWLSEIILQQTRVEQGLNYYNRFIKNYPTITHLANAKDEAVYKLWEGLGYYSRCKNLLITARIIKNECSSIFPDTYAQILALKGIGPYTAAAISSFAFNLPHAVVDGNVYRVLARIFGRKEPIDTQSGKIYFSQLALDLLDKKWPGVYNQAIMDFGAGICKPANPHCRSCPFASHCIAFQSNTVEVYPVKSKKNPVKLRWFYYFIINQDNKIAVQQRLNKDIWQNLNEFYLYEATSDLSKTQILNGFKKQTGFKKQDFSVTVISKLFKQQLSHQLITGRFIEIDLQTKIPLPQNLRWVKKNQLSRLAFPRFINGYLEQQNEG